MNFFVGYMIYKSCLTAKQSGSFFDVITLERRYAAKGTVHGCVSTAVGKMKESL